MKKYIFLAFLVLSLTGCREWLDINHNPNNPSKEGITMDQLLSSAQYETIDRLVNSTNAHMIAQHLTKSGEFSGAYTFLTGLIMPQDVDGWWEVYYTTVANLKLIEEKAIEAEDNAFKGVSILLQVFNFQRVVDIFGNVPYSEACKPDEFSTPKFDKDSEIYADLLKRADEAITALETAKANNQDLGTLAKVDIICYGDIDQWIRVAYSIKLRLLMRESMVVDVASEVQKIADKCLHIDENVIMNPGYYLEDDKMNIFYQYYGYDAMGDVVTNYRQYMPTRHLVDMLRDNNDPRLRVFCDPRPVLGNEPESSADYEKFGLGDEHYVGIPYGQTDPPRMDYTCRTGLGLLAGGSDKSAGAVKGNPFITGAEIGFYLAEAALRGLIPGGDAKAQEYYEQSVISAMKRHENAMQDKNFTMVGVAPAIETDAETAAREYLAQDNAFMNWNKMTTEAQKMDAIHSQKWLNYFGYNPLEAWFEARRTGYPSALVASNQAQENKLICKLPYPQTERNLNAENVALQGEVDVYNSLVFWDKENPIINRAELYQ